MKLITFRKEDSIVLSIIFYFGNTKRLLNYSIINLIEHLFLRIYGASQKSKKEKERYMTLSN